MCDPTIGIRDDRQTVAAGSKLIQYFTGTIQQPRPEVQFTMPHGQWIDIAGEVIYCHPDFREDRTEVEIPALGIGELFAGTKEFIYLLFRDIFGFQQICLS